MKNKFSLTIFNRILCIFIIFLGIGYIACTNDLSIKGFELQESKIKLQDAMGNNNNLELEMMSLGAYNNLSEKVAALDMVAQGKIDYVSGVDALVAKK